MNDDNKLIIERVFDAPLEEVWKYFSEPEYYKKWFGPKDFIAPVAEIDFKVGGKLLIAMHGPKGSEWDKNLWSTGIYKEIVPPNPLNPSEQAKIVITDSFADENGNVVPGTYYGMECMPLEMLVTMEFKPIQAAGKEQTKLKLTHEGIKDIPEEHRQGMESGWNQSFDKIDLSIK